MTDVNTIASRYIDLWNERTPSRRREILSQHWTSDAKYVDPLMSGDGHDGVDALIEGVQQRFPDFFYPARPAQRFRRPCPLLLGPRPGRRGQPDQGHGFRRGARRQNPKHHRIFGSGPAGRVTNGGAQRIGEADAAKKQSRANPRADAAMKLLLPGAPDPEQVTPRGALRSMQRYRLHLGF
jgi:hypothetical protein